MTTSSFDVADLAFAADRIVIAGTETRQDGATFLYVARYVP